MALEGALVSVGMGVMKPLLSKLYKAIKDENSKLKGVRRQIEGTRKEMSSMEAALETLADAEKLNPRMVLWRDNIRELSYDMEDCIDDFMARADTKQEGPKGFKGFVDKVKKLKPRHEIAGEITKLKARAIAASEMHKRYKLDHPTPESTTCDIDPRLRALYMNIGKLVGIDGPKKHIIEWFKNEDSSTQLRVVSIVGAGGLGKTTLAKAVYDTIRSEFSCVAFVSVSRKPNMKNLLREIAIRLGVTDNTSDDGEHLLIDKLREHLQDKKYLVVVDDIWNTKAWEDIKIALPNNSYNSRIITTTRNGRVASFCSSQGGYVYEMKPLSSTDSRRLFLERAFYSEDLFPPNLEEVFQKILGKCAGLPLAIITLSSLLKDETAEEIWNRVLGAIGSSIANEQHDMTKILSLSYFDLPHPMRTCLLYLSAYPEDHTIEKRSLIHKWMAEGFIREEKERSAYQVGEHYFNDFINRSLIQAADLLEEHEENGQVSACRVHDIILDFITCKANEEHFMTSFGDVDAGHMNGHKVRRLSVMNHDVEMADVSADLSHVRSLAIIGNFMLKSPIIPKLDFLVLRVLDLGGCWDLEDEDLANIEKLLLLKYLRLKSLGSSNEIPRWIGNLKYLETLDMRGVVINKLPSTMTQLQRLARLYASFSLSCSWDGIIGQLQSLEELEDVDVRSSELEKFLQELAHLTKLMTLSVTVCREEEKEDPAIGTLLSLHNIHNLRIDHETKELLSLESWRPANPAAFRQIYIHGYYIDKVPIWMRLLGNLRALDLSMFCMGPEDVAILGQIPALAFLKLQTWYGRNGRILMIRGFRSLKRFSLTLMRCGTAVEFEEGSMPRLEHLELQINAHEMDCMNNSSDFGIEHLSALIKVDLVLYHGDASNDIIHKIERTINTVVEKLRNRPTLSLRERLRQCSHFEAAIKDELLGLAGLAGHRSIRNTQNVWNTLGTYLGRRFQEISPDAPSFFSMINDEEEYIRFALLCDNVTDADDEEEYEEEYDLPNGNVTDASTRFTLTPLGLELDHLQLSLAVTHEIHDGKTRTKTAKVSAAKVRRNRREGKARTERTKASAPKNKGYSLQLGGNGDTDTDTSAPFTFTDMRHELDAVQGLPSSPWFSPPPSIDASSSALPDNGDNIYADRGSEEEQRSVAAQLAVQRGKGAMQPPPCRD